MGHNLCPHRFRQPEVRAVSLCSVVLRSPSPSLNIEEAFTVIGPKLKYTIGPFVTLNTGATTVRKGGLTAPWRGRAGPGRLL